MEPCNGTFPYQNVYKITQFSGMYYYYLLICFPFQSPFTQLVRKSPSLILISRMHIKILHIHELVFKIYVKYCKKSTEEAFTDFKFLKSSRPLFGSFQIHVPRKGEGNSLTHLLDTASTGYLPYI